MRELDITEAIVGQINRQGGIRSKDEEFLLKIRGNEEIKVRTSFDNNGNIHFEVVK